MRQKFQKYQQPHSQMCIPSSPSKEVLLLQMHKGLLIEQYFLAKVTFTFPLRCFNPPAKIRHTS